MRLTILGCGTVALCNNSSSYFVESPKAKILLDMGRGAINSMKKADISPYDLDAILITHFHTDHTIELAPFISAIINNPENKKLKRKYVIYGPADIKIRLAKFISSFELTMKRFSKHFDVKILSPGKTVMIKDISIKSYPAVHYRDIECISLRLTSHNKSLFYSGDSEKSKYLIEGSKNSDVALLECTLRGLKGHMSGTDAGDIAKTAGIKKLILTHIDPNYNKALSDARKNYQGRIITAKELMKINI